jgi:predicted O-methyltransferase YrrM
VDSAIEAVLRRYEERAAAETKRMQELAPAEFTKHIDEFLLAVGPATGQLMNLLIKEAKARTILELGTSHGYSTVWLAEAARATSGKVISMDVHPGKQEYARRALSSAGLAEFAEFKLGDARESIAALPGPIDFVLLDLWKDLYIPCFDLFYPKLGSGAMVIADNMIFPEFSRRDAEDYRRHVRAKSDLQSVLLPVGSGLEVSRCTRGLEFK